MTDEQHNIKELEELKKEWAEFKSRSFWVLTGFISIAVGYGVWVGTIQSEHNQFAHEVAQNAQIIKESQLRLNAVEINNSGVLARLAGIETTLQEIKVAIKQIK